MGKYPYPASFFSPPDPRPAEWPDEPNVRAAVGWLRSFMAQADWNRRRAAAADRLYDTILQRNTDPKGRFFAPGDTLGWHLFLAEAFIDHMWNYEPTYGSRVVPVMQSIGRNLPLLLEIEGVNERAARLVGPEKAQPNGGLFELLVAAAYRRAGAKVRFVPEQPGRAKTHDLDVELNGCSFAVECKRMETGDYGEFERQRIRELWGPFGSSLAENGFSVLANAQFKAALDKVPDDYFLAHCRRYIGAGQLPVIWDDQVSRGFIRELDLRPLQEVLKTEMVLAGGSRLAALLTGEYVRNGPMNTIVRMKYADNPRYIEDCNLAVILRYESAAPEAIDIKARDIQRKLVEANAQLPGDRPGVVHIGFEAVEGDVVEAARYEKILSTARKFDPQGKPLQFIYCHYLVPESPPEEAFAYDETTQWMGLGASMPMPLENVFLVLDTDGRSRRGPHWAPIDPPMN